MNVELQDKNTFKQKFKKRCFDFSISILNTSQKLGSEQINRVLLDQLIRSATSIGANVVEGGSASSRKDFTNFFQISYKSASETLYWLALLKELNKSHSETIEVLIEECIEIKKLISTILINTKNNSKL